MKSINFGSIAKSLRESRPDKEHDPIRYDSWLKVVHTFAQDLASRELRGFDTEVFLYKCGAKK